MASTAVVRYPENAPQPTWDDEAATFRAPDTGEAVPSWDEALDELDEQLDTNPQQGPEHVVRFGTQVNLQGVLAGTDRANKLISYLSKYLTKSVAECHQAQMVTAAEHQRRLFDELRFTPCSPRCPNWLHYGIQPSGARQQMRAGSCKAKVHQLDTLGIGGCRVLVSRQWSGKTLADHKYDQTLWVRHLLAVARGSGDDLDADTTARVNAAREGGSPAPIAWELAKPGDPGVPDLPRLIMRAIAARIRHRAAIAAAKATGPPADVSATAVGDG